MSKLVGQPGGGAAGCAAVRQFVDAQCGQCHSWSQGRVQRAVPAPGAALPHSQASILPWCQRALSENMCRLQAGDVKKTADYVAQVGLYSLLSVCLQSVAARVPAR